MSTVMSLNIHIFIIKVLKVSWTTNAHALSVFRIFKSDRIAANVFALKEVMKYIGIYLLCLG